MNPNEIKKGLECCTCPVYDCDSCPLYGKLQEDCVCGNHLMKHALAYINQLETEVERLNTENRILSQKRFNIFERLEFTDKIRIEAIKEFTERLKEKIDETDEVNTYWLFGYLEYLVKEMVGEQNV